MKALKAAVAYFGCVFGAGFVLGSIRVPFLVPRLGVRVAELIEMPLMAIVIWFSAHMVVRRFALAPAMRVRMAVGVIALALLLAAEFLLALWVQGISVAQYVAERDPVSGTVYVAMLFVFALLPIWVRS